MHRLIKTYLISGLSLLSVNLTTTVQAEQPTLSNIHQITYDGNSIAPRFSPNADLIAFTQAKYQGLYVTSAPPKDGSLRAFSTRAPAQLSDDAQVGFQFSWSGDGQSIVGRFSDDGVQQQAGKVNVKSGEYQALSAPAMDVSIPVVSGDTVGFTENTEGKQVVLPPAPGTVRLFNRRQPAPSIREQNGQIFINQRLVSPSDTQCWLPIIAPDELKVAFECWEGLFVYHLFNEKLYPLGKGSSPSWASDSQQLVYEITQDEGHIVIQSDIYMIRYDGTAKRNLTENIYLIARRPSLSADGKQLAFDSDGNLFIADLQGVQ